VRIVVGGIESADWKAADVPADGKTLRIEGGDISVNETQRKDETMLRRRRS